jgi:hypothetical protein
MLRSNKIGDEETASEYYKRARRNRLHSSLEDNKISSLEDEIRLQDQNSMDSLSEAKSDSWISPISAHCRER